MTGCTGPPQQRETDLCSVRPGRRRAAVQCNKEETERKDEVSEKLVLPVVEREPEFGSFGGFKKSVTF